MTVFAGARTSGEPPRGRSVLCWLQGDPGGALTVARDLADSAGDDVAAVRFAPEGDAAIVIGLDQYAPLAWARALAGLARSIGASAVVAPATDRGNEVLAHLGAITGEPMAANCVSATWAAPGVCRLTRQRWAGSLLEDAVLESGLALLTVAADAVPAAAAPEPALVIERYEPELADGDLDVRASEAVGEHSGASLGTARVVVGGGRGVGGPDGFAALEELAGLLGGAVGVSRVVTSNGWRPHRQQVGQTGTKITADLYLACGISGAIQHMAGCQAARTIVAINTDAGAPIVAKADYAVIGDLHEVIPALTAAIRGRLRTDA